MTVATHDRILDALDNAPYGTIAGEVDYSGRLATVQWLAGEIGRSDSATRRAVHSLHERGLVDIYDARDAKTSNRRLFVTGGDL